MKKTASARKKRGGEIFIGTSGWMYKDWGKRFYPKDTKDFLGYFSEHFRTVEINNTFYRMPSAKVFENWKDQVPEGFIFAVKLNRYITHIKRMKEPKEYRSYLKQFLTNASKLEDKLGPILVQLPPSLQYHPERVQAFLKEAKKITDKLDISPRYAFEPRHPSWFEDHHENIFKKMRMAPVFAESSKFVNYEPKDIAEKKIVYLRFHGPKRFAASKYGKTLEPWAKKIKEWSKQGATVYAYFNNDVHGYAIGDAELLKKYCGVD